MSSDKRKKLQRAYAFIRDLRRGGRGYPKGEAKTVVNGRPSRTMTYCLKRGLAVLRRVEMPGYYNTLSRNIFDAD